MNPSLAFATFTAARRVAPSVLPAVMMFIAAAASGQAAPPTMNFAGQQSQRPSPVETKAEAGRLLHRPLAFEPRPEGGGYITRGGGATLSLGREGATMQLATPHPAKGGNSGAVTLHLQMEGAAQPEPTALEPLAGHASYFFGDQPSQWRSNVPQFGRVTYRSVYPGIDLTFYGSQSVLEHDFVVAPGFDPKAIRMRFSGASREALGRNGDLKIAAGGGTLLLHRPMAYQVLADGSRHDVQASFVTLPGHRAAFQLGAYDHTLPLTIDPVLEYSTYFGGSSVDAVIDMATDAAGNLYVIGETGSPDLPLTGQIPGVCAGTCGANNVNTSSSPYTPTLKIFILKLDPTGQTLLASTYLGGSGADDGMAIQPAADGIYFAGSTTSTDFPHVNAYSTSFPPTSVNRSNVPGTTFLAKLTLDGSQLLYSTNIGYASEYLQYTAPLFAVTDFTKPLPHDFLAVGSNGIVYVMGFAGENTNNLGTPYPDFPDARNALFQDGQDFVAKFDTTLVGSASLIYSTPVGIIPGTETNYNEVASLAGIATDSKDDLWIYGTTTSYNFPTTTANAYQATCDTASGGCGNAFLMELQPDGQAVTYASYLGGGSTRLPGNGTSTDIAYGIRIDHADRIYLVGYSGATTFPYTNQAVGSGAGGYLVQFSPDGTRLQYGIRIGACCTFAVNDAGLAALATSLAPGYNFGTGDRFVNGGSSAYMNEVYEVIDTTSSTAAAQLSYSVGPETNAAGVTVPHAAAFSPAGDLYLGGGTNDPGMTVVNALHSTCASCNASPALSDAYIQKIKVTVTRPTVSPATLTFTSPGAYTESAEQFVTVTNNAAFPITYRSVVSPSGAFGQERDGTCLNGPIPAGGSCTVSIVFNPPLNQSYSETGGINTTYDYVTVPITFIGTISNGITVTAAPGALTFGPLAYNMTSAAQTVTITNTGSNDAAISGVSVSGTNSAMFHQTNNCGATLAVAASCTVSITFSASATPPETGTSSFSASLNIADSAGNSPQTVALTGTESAPPGQASINPTTLTFPSTTVGSSSAAQAVTLTNSGAGVLNITAITLGGANGIDFTQANNCGSSLAVGNSCTINVTFAPLSSAGNEVATLTLTDNANATAGSTQTVTLTGTSTGLTATLTPSLYAFGSVPQTAAASINFMLSNTSNVGFSITSIQLASEPTNSYSYTTTCGNTLAANASCMVTVIFKPSTLGGITSTLTIKDGAGTQSAPLAGTGVPPLSLAPATYSFGNVAVNSPASYAPFAVTNNGAAAVAIASVALTPNSKTFVLGNGCPANLAGGASCNITVAFVPASAGAASAVLNVQDAGGNVASSAISGTGVAPTATLTPSTYVFPDTQVGNTAVAALTLTNTTAAAISFTAVSLTSGTQDAEIEPTGNNCPATLQAGATCTVTVRFSPTKVGPSDAALEVTDGAGTQIASVSGTGTQPLAVSPASYGFGNVLVGLSASTTFTLTNISAVTVTGIALSGPTVTIPYSSDFATTSTCGGTLAVNASCTFTVTFRPSGAHLAQTYLNISDDGGTLTPGVSGTGIAPTATLTPATFVFPNTQVGNTVSTTFTLTNTSPGVLSFTSVNLTSGTQDTEIEPTGNTCPASLQTGATCTIAVRFSPTKIGLSDAALEVTDGAGTQIASISGTGTQPLSITPASFDFGSVAVGNSASTTFTLTNVSGVTVMGIALLPPAGSPAYSSDFSTSTTCGSALAVNASCTYTVTFRPSGLHLAQSYLNISDAGGSLTPGISGTGVSQPDFTISGPASVSFNTGGHATFSLIVASAASGNPFTGVIGLSGSGLPNGTTYAFNPSTVSPGNNPQNIVLDVQLPATARMNEAPPILSHHDGAMLAGVSFFGMLFTFHFRRRGQKAVRLCSLILGTVCLLLATATVSGCGASPSRAPTVSAALLITGTCGSISHSTSVLAYYTQR